MKTYTTKQAASLLKRSESSFRKLASVKRRQGDEWRAESTDGRSALWLADKVDAHRKFMDGYPQADELERSADKAIGSGLDPGKGAPGLSYIQQNEQAERFAPKEHREDEVGWGEAPAIVSHTETDKIEENPPFGRQSKKPEPAAPEVGKLDVKMSVSLKTITSMRDLLNGKSIKPSDWYEMMEELDALPKLED